MAFIPPHGFWNAPRAFMGFVGFVRVQAGTVKVITMESQIHLMGHI